MIKLTKKSLKLFLALVSLGLTSYTVQAEQKTEFNGHELHYIVLNTTELPAEIANTYGITRSGQRAFINLSVLHKEDNGYHTPVPADVTAIHRNLIGQTKTIELQEIREGDAIYYIGTFKMYDQDVLWFDVEVSVKDTPVYDFSFSQKVWRE